MEFKTRTLRKEEFARVELPKNIRDELQLSTKVIIDIIFIVVLCISFLITSQDLVPLYLSGKVTADVSIISFAFLLFCVVSLVYLWFRHSADMFFISSVHFGEVIFSISGKDITANFGKKSITLRNVQGTQTDDIELKGMPQFMLSGKRESNWKYCLFTYNHEGTCIVSIVEKIAREKPLFTKNGILTDEIIAMVTFPLNSKENPELVKVLNGMALRKTDF